MMRIERSRESKRKETMRIVRKLLTTYPGITRTEIAEKMGCALPTVHKYVIALRSEWDGTKPVKPHRRVRPPYIEGVLEARRMTNEPEDDEPPQTSRPKSPWAREGI